MGALLSAPFSLAATCCGAMAGNCVAGMCCKACSCGCVASRKCSSIIYMITLMTFTLFALWFRYEGGDIVIGGGYNATAATIMDRASHASRQGAMDYWNKRFVCAPAHPNGLIICCRQECGGVFAVYRFSFVLCLFFAFLCVCTIATTKFGARVHRGFWFGKLFILIMLLISTIFVDNHAMAAYRDVARVCSIAFIVVQQLLVIDFGYRSNEYLIELDERDSGGGDESRCSWKVAILVSAVVLYTLSIVTWVLASNSFGKKDGCAGQQALISLTIIVTVLLSIASCTRYCPHGTLLTSAIVTAYATYWCYSALASQPNPLEGESGPHCNPFADRDTNNFDLFVGMAFFAVSMASTAWSLTGSKEKIMGLATSTTTNADLTVSLDGGATTTSSGDKPPADDDEGPVEPESWWYYHLMMVVCSFYMCQMLTDWSVQPVDSPLAAHFAVSNESFWVKVVALWVCLGLYAWTLLAPYLLRNHRSFGIEFDFD